MTKKDFISLILSHVNGGSFTTDVFKKVHPKILASYIELALNDVMFQIFKDTRNYELYATWFTDIAITKYIMGLYRCDYPTPIVQNVNKTNSIIRIVPTEDIESTSFMPSTPSEAVQSSRLGTNGRNGIVSYVTVQDGIHFYSHNENVTLVNIFAFKPISEYGMSDDLPIPAGTSDAVLKFVLQYVKSEQPTKTVIDSDPDN